MEACTLTMTPWLQQFRTKKLKQSFNNPLQQSTLAKEAGDQTIRLRLHKSTSRKLGNPDLLVLALSSHDWDDTMTFCYSGHTRDMPGKMYFALHGLWNKYFGPTDSCDTPAGNTLQNPGLNQWLQWSRSTSTQMVVYLHPTQDELRNEKREARGALLTEWLTTNAIPCVDGMQFMKASDYRDNIHPNERGQKQLAEALFTAEIHKKISK